MRLLEFYQTTEKNTDLPRHQGVFLVDDLEDGYNHWGENEHIYMVRPLGPIYGPFHVGWVNTLDYDVQSGRVGEIEELTDGAENYWDGVAAGEAGWEYYANEAKVVDYLGQTHQLWESEIKEIKQRAGLLE